MEQRSGRCSRPNATRQFGRGACARLARLFRWGRLCTVIPEKAVLLALTLFRAVDRVEAAPSLNYRGQLFAPTNHGERVQPLRRLPPVKDRSPTVAGWELDINSSLRQ